MIALSASARARKCQLKKEGKSEEEIWKYLATNGYISDKSAINNSSAIKQSSIPRGNDSVITKADEPLPAHLTVDLVEQYLIRLTREDPSAQVAAQLISWLDKRKELKKAEDQLATIDLAGLMSDGNGTPA
jgi:hypothetical protein